MHRVHCFSHISGHSKQQAHTYLSLGSKNISLDSCCVGRQHAGGSRGLLQVCGIKQSSAADHGETAHLSRLQAPNTPGKVQDGRNHRYSKHPQDHRQHGQQRDVVQAYRAARSWRDIASVWRSQTLRPSPSSVAVLFNTLGKVVQLKKLQQQEQQELITWVMGVLERLPLAQLDHTATGSILAGMARSAVNRTNVLHATGSPAAAQALSAKFDRLLLLRTHQLQQADTWPPQYFGMVAIALKRLNHTPPSPWVKSFFTQSQPVLHSIEPIGLANIAVGLAALHIAPPPTWQEPFLTACQARLPEFNHQSLGELLHAVAQLGMCPDDAWLQAFASAAHSQVGQASAHSATNLVQGLAKLGPAGQRAAGIMPTGQASHSPQQQQRKQGNHSGSSSTAGSGEQQHLPLLAAHVQVVASRLLPDMQLSNLGPLLWALGSLGHSPPAAQLDALLAAVARCTTRGANPGYLSLALLGVSNLKVQPPQQWLQQLLEVLQGGMGGAHANAVANLLQALVLLGHQPRAELLQAAAARVLDRLDMYSAEDLQQVLGSLSQLRYRPPAALPRAVLQRYGGRGGGIQDGQELLAMMLASEAAGFDDARQWEQQVEDGVTRLGPQLPPSQLAGVLQHLGRLSWASSSGALLERLLPCLLQAAPQLSAPELAGSLWAAAKLGAAIPSPSRAVLLEVVASRAADMRWMQLSNVLWAAPVLGLMPSQAQLDQLLEALRRQQGPPKPQEAAALLMGLAQLATMAAAVAPQQGAAGSSTAGGTAALVVPDAPLLQLLQHLADAQQVVEHRTIATAASALDMLPRLAPPASFWSAYFSTTARLLPACSAPSLAAIIKPVAARQLAPSSGWLQQYSGAVQQALGSFKARQLAGVVAALYTLREPVPAPVLDVLCSYDSGLSHGLVGRVIDSMDSYLEWHQGQEGQEGQEGQGGQEGGQEEHSEQQGTSEGQQGEMDYDAFIGDAYEQLKSAGL